MHKFIGVIIWVIGTLMILPTVVSNDNKVETIDISGLKAKEIVIGATKLLKPDFEISSAEQFFALSYDLVLIGFENDHLIYYGKNENGWYKAEKVLPLGISQKIREVRGENQKLTIVYGKDVGTVVVSSFMIIIVFGLIGAAVFF
jgi:hypothetical protein